MGSRRWPRRLEAPSPTSRATLRGRRASYSLDVCTASARALSRHAGASRALGGRLCAACSQPAALSARGDPGHAGRSAPSAPCSHRLQHGGTLRLSLRQGRLRPPGPSPGSSLGVTPTHHSPPRAAESRVLGDSGRETEGTR